jgi:small-conductance mechanosensitive channel
MNELLSREFFNNTLSDYLIASGIIIIGLFLLAIFKRYLLGQLRKWATSSKTELDDLVVNAIDRFGLPVASLLFIYWGISYLTLVPKTEKVLNIIIAVILAIFILRLLSTIIKNVLRSYILKQDKGEEKIKQLTGLMILINIVVWVLGAIFLFDNLGYNVSTILTGVGIGGVAVALAAQNIIGDLFNYFVIFFDKPFEVGDAINVDDKNGTIEYIGLKTTRLRGLTGEQIILANSDLAKSRVHNFKRQNIRRIQFSISVVYQTSTELLKEIPVFIKKIIEEINDTRFDRAHFARFSDYGLTFEVVYFVLVADYNRYMDIQQQINLRIIDEFKERKIKFLIREDLWHRNTAAKINAGPVQEEVSSVSRN